MGLLLFDDDVDVAIAGVASAQTTSIGANVVPPANLSLAGVASAQTSAIGVTVVAPPAPVAVSIAGVASAQVTSIQSGSMHHRAPSPRLFYARSASPLPRTAPVKDPNEILDYTITYEGVLEADEAITSSIWALSGPDGALVVGTGSRASTNDDDSVTIWLAAGTTESGPYLATNHIVTDHTPPREYERSFSLTVADL